MKTRSKKVTKTAATKNEEPETTQSKAKTLEPSESNPPQLFILPKDTSSESRIITLPNPGTAAPSRYFACPEKGFFEFTRVAAPKSTLSSWLLAPDREQKASSESIEESNGDCNEQAYVLEKPDLLVATPIDPLFIVLPLLVAQSQQNTYLTFSDYLYTSEGSEHAVLRHTLRQTAFLKLEKTLERRMAVICNALDMGDDNDKMFQFSLPKLAAELVSKARKMCESGLPASMEEHFVKAALEVPVLSIKREESSVSAENDEATPTAEDEPAPTSTASETVATVTAVSTEPSVSSEVIELLRQRTAIDYMLHSYIPSEQRTAVKAHLASEASPINFKPLDAHLSRIAEMKKQAQALRSLSDNISRKRTIEQDEDAMDRAEAKKRKKEEEDFKKKNMSRGVQQLAKADTSGMKKLSAFFAKAPPKKKA